MNQDTITHLIIATTLATFLLVLIQKIRANHSGKTSCGNSCGCKINKKSPPKSHQSHKNS